MKEKNHLFSATGIPSLFLIFGVLMLVILSLLGYGTSRQDLRASSLSLEQTSAYYNACSEAADFYSELVQALEGFKAQAKTETAYYQLVCTADSTASDNVASDTINAGLDVTSSNIAGILSWNTVVTADWNPDNSQSVYKGE